MARYQGQDNLMASAYRAIPLPSLARAGCSSNAWLQRSRPYPENRLNLPIPLNFGVNPNGPILAGTGAGIYPEFDAYALTAESG